MEEMKHKGEKAWDGVCWHMASAKQGALGPEFLFRVTTMFGWSGSLFRAETMVDKIRESGAPDQLEPPFGLSLSCVQNPEVN